VDKYRIPIVYPSILYWRDIYYNVFINQAIATMKNVDARYWIELVVVTLMLVAIGFIAFIFFLPGYYPPILPFMLLTFVVMTAAGQVILGRLLSERFSKFNSAFMIYKALKILILATFMVTYAALNSEFVIPFLGATLIMYLVFMVFESRSLNRQSRKQAEQ
jgi:hypothetical protein